MTFERVPYTTRQDWLEKRRQGIGASDIAAIIGISPWSTPLQIWVSKTIDEIPEAEETEDMAWGIAMERLIIEETAQRLDASTTVIPILCRNVERPWMLATPDAIANEDDGADFLIEAKKVDAWSWDEIPPHYVMQVQWQLAVTGLGSAVLAVLHRGRRLELYPVAADPEMQQELITAGEAFWELVEAVTPPTVVAADNRYLAELWPTHEEKPVEVDPGLIADLHLAREFAKAAKEEVDTLEAQLKAAMEEADTAIIGQDVVATWKTQTSNRLDTKRLRVDHPVIAEEYTRKGTSRVLRIREPKE